MRRIRSILVEMSEPDDVNEVVDNMNISQTHSQVPPREVDQVFAGLKAEQNRTVDVYYRSCGLEVPSTDSMKPLHAQNSPHHRSIPRISPDESGPKVARRT